MVSLHHGNDTFTDLSNYTEYAEIPYYIKVTSMTFCIVIMCLGVIGNVMVPIVILKTKDMRNSTNIFLVNLSIADLMVLLVCTPTVLVEVNSRAESWVLGRELCLAVPFVELTVAHASVLTILAISFERYYAICEPLRAGYVCTKTRATLICALAWFFAALFTSPILGIAEHTEDWSAEGAHARCATPARTPWQISFFLMVILFLYFLPLVILVVLYSVIAKNLITAASKVVMNKTVDPYNARARKQVILMLGTVVLCFFLCLMPYRILILWIIVTPSEWTESMNPETCPILGVATFTYEVYEDGSENPVCLTQADTFWSALFFILTIAVFFIVPLGVLLVLYSVIAKNLMENPVIIAQNSKNNNNTNNVLRYRKQVILMLGTVVLSFFLCLLPFKALTLWIIVFPPETIMSLGIDGYYILLYFCRIMLYLNSAINPILYNLMSSKFREGFVKLLRINKLMNCGRSLRENMQRRDTFNTTTSTGFSSSQHNSDSFWRRYSNRTSSQKNVIKDKKKKEPEPNVQQLKVGEIINVVNTRRNSMQFISAMNELNDNKIEVEVHEHNCQDEDTATENNKQIQILNLDVKTNNVYSITLDVTEKSEGKNRFVCVPVQDRENKNIFVYDFKSKESFV
ncbi:thyrotropin-releasing hormone receptor-like isoform X1 [Leguminivora glycinivorella]|uniref:thyrotropin-releasing hormone receptor-like isoform X1 n=1 Tax=Leguminivora glycinivorella TaxID=1035111 RepID=UPI00200DCFB7|nr:thyrotropin-releasing hormone receptor-like isoform X1 [Leguminivora glycinivorella]